MLISALPRRGPIVGRCERAKTLPKITWSRERFPAETRKRDESMPKHRRGVVTKDSAGKIRGAAEFGREERRVRT